MGERQAGYPARSQGRPVWRPVAAVVLRVPAITQSRRVDLRVGA